MRLDTYGFIISRRFKPGGWLQLTSCIRNQLRVVECPQSGLFKLLIRDQQVEMKNSAFAIK